MLVSSLTLLQDYNEHGCEKNELVSLDQIVGSLGRRRTRFRNGATLRGWTQGISRSLTYSLSQKLTTIKAGTRLSKQVPHPNRSRLVYEVKLQAPLETALRTDHQSEDPPPYLSQYIGLHD
jgi:hypothetical protein